MRVDVLASSSLAARASFDRNASGHHVFRWFWTIHSLVHAGSKSSGATWAVHAAALAGWPASPPRSITSSTRFASDTPSAPPPRGDRSATLPTRARPLADPACTCASPRGYSRRRRPPAERRAPLRRVDAPPRDPSAPPRATPRPSRTSPRFPRRFASRQRRRPLRQRRWRRRARRPKHLRALHVAQLDARDRRGKSGIGSFAGRHRAIQSNLANAARCSPSDTCAFTAACIAASRRRRQMPSSPPSPELGFELATAGSATPRSRRSARLLRASIRQRVQRVRRLPRTTQQPGSSAAKILSACGTAEDPSGAVLYLGSSRLPSCRSSSAAPPNVRSFVRPGRGTSSARATRATPPREPLGRVRNPPRDRRARLGSSRARRARRPDAPTRATRGRPPAPPSQDGCARGGTAGRCSNTAEGRQGCGRRAPGGVAGGAVGGWAGAGWSCGAGGTAAPGEARDGAGRAREVVEPRRGRDARVGDEGGDGGRRGRGAPSSGAGRPVPRAPPR